MAYTVQSSPAPTNADADLLILIGCSSAMAAYAITKIVTIAANNIQLPRTDRPTVAKLTVDSPIIQPGARPCINALLLPVAACLTESRPTERDRILRWRIRQPKSPGPVARPEAIVLALD